MLIYTPVAKEVEIKVKAFDPQAEFVQYTLSDQGGGMLRAGAMAEGRIIRFTGEKGQRYYLNIASRRGSVKLEVKGASIAYRPEGIATRYMDGPLPLYFHVPEQVRSFDLTLGTPGAVADIFFPGGQPAGRLDCSETGVSRLVFKDRDSQTGFWKILLHRYEGGHGSISLTIDGQLPQWFIPDPAHPLKISPGQ
jgi:hypothetical protein